MRIWKTRGTTLRCHLTPIRMAITHTHQQNKWQMLARMRKKTEPVYTVGGNINWCSHYGKQYWSSSKKPKDRTTTRSSNTTFGCFSEESKNPNLRRYMHPYVHCSIIYNSQYMEATKVSINKSMDKEDIYIHREIKKKSKIQNYLIVENFPELEKRSLKRSEINWWKKRVRIYTFHDKISGKQELKEILKSFQII